MAKRTLTKKSKTGQKVSKTPVKSNTRRQGKNVVSPAATSTSSPTSEETEEDTMSVNTEQHENGDDEPFFVDRKFCTFCSLRFSVAKANKATDTMRLKLQELMTILQQADDSVMFTIYKTDPPQPINNLISTSPSLVLASPEDLPTSITALSKHFFGARPNSKGGTVWAQVRLIHNGEIENIITDTSEDFKLRESQLFKQTIQHWDVKCLGFLKNLHPDVDVNLLSTFFQSTIATMTNTNLVFGLKVKTPYDGRKRDPKASSSYRDRIQAVHVEVVNNNMKETGTLLKQVLTSTAFSTRYKCIVRLVPCFDRNSSPYQQEKIRKCIVQHGQFCKCVASNSCEGIEYLDIANKALGKTLRECILSIPDSHFINVDLNWSKSSFAIQYPIKYEEMARERIAHLGPYLHRTFGDKILSSLPVATQQEISEITWDEETNRPVSKLEKELDDILNEGTTLEFVDMSLLEDKDPKRPEATAPSNTFIPKLDTDSHSTFGTVKQNTTTPSAGLKKAAGHDRKSFAREGRLQGLTYAAGIGGDAHSRNACRRGEHSIENRSPLSLDVASQSVSENSLAPNDGNQFHSHRWSQLSDVPVHGDPLVGKDPSTVRFYYENVDGFVPPSKKKNNSKKFNNNNKQKFLSTLLSRLDVDVFAGVELRQQWDLISKTDSLQKQLDVREGGKIQTSHNVHERFSASQQGGTCLVSNELIGTYVTAQGEDDEFLGRYSWLKFSGRTVNTRVVVAYFPCKTRKQATQATIAQHKRYWRLQGNHQCPRKLLREALCKQLQLWRDQGDKLILFVDSNENMDGGPLARMLQHEDLDMVDAIKTRSQLPGPNTFVRGSRQIDGVWVTKDIELSRACFLPFYFGVGDHRGIILDIPQSTLLGGNVHCIARPSSRRLTCGNPDIQTKYNDVLDLYCQKHRIQQKIYSLFPASHKLDDRDKRTLEKIDKVLGEGMVHAEKKCRKIRAGTVPFSDKLVLAGCHMKVWQLVIRHKERNTVNTRRIRRAAKKCGLTRVLAVSLETAKHRLATAWTKYKKIKRSAARHRQNFLIECEDKATSEKAKRAIRMIRKHEETRRAWKFISKSQGKKRNKGISSVEVCNDGTWQELSTRTEVEAAIMENNSARFQLTSSTPLMSSYMSSKLGYLANTPFAKSVLDGSFSHDPLLDDYTNNFLAFIGSKDRLSSIDASVLTQDFVNYWSGSRERTSSSMSGRHFGHYKAASRRPRLSEIHASLVHIASISGYTLSRWKNGLTVMLEKIEGVTRVNKLRAILLMEADFNFLNKLVFGSRMMHQTESCFRVPDELYGSRSGKSAIEVAVNRRLVIDNFKQMRRSGAIAGVDAAQCYDRIVHSLSSLVCQNEGVPISCLLMMYGAIQSMRFHIRTTFGDSTSFYGGEQRIPFQGSCQGNGASPALWLVITIYLVLLMKEAGHTSTITSPITGVVLTLVGFLFVDDTDLVITAQENESVESMCLRLQQSVDYWNGILRVSGGSLRPEKCYWYLATFEWINGVSHLVDNSEHSISISTDSGTRERIKLHASACSAEAVGVWQDLTGSSEKQVAVLLDKIEGWHTAAADSPLPRHLAWTALRQSMWKSIDYTLPAITLSRRQADTLASALYRRLLPRLGCNRNFPLALRYNPSYLLGLGLYDPLIEQGIHKLFILFNHGNTSTMTGKLIQSNLEQLQLEVGSFTQVLLLHHPTYSIFVPQSWLTTLWEFVSQFDIQLTSSTRFHPQPLRLHDQALMDIFVTVDGISQSDLLSINRVRCYLQLFSLADMVTGDGRRFQEDILNGTLGSTRSIWTWHEERPTSKDFRVWRRSLKKLTDAQGLLSQPLGPWIATPHRPIVWFYEEARDLVFHKINNTFISYQRSQCATRTHPRFVKSDLQTFPQAMLGYTTVKILDDNTVIFQGSHCTNTLHLPPPISKTPDPFWCLSHSNIHTEGLLPWVAAGLLTGTLKGVCDGSYKPHLDSHGISAAFVIEGSENKEQIQGFVTTRGITADPYRGELLGIYAILSCISYIESHNAKFTTGQLRIGCDNEKAGWISGISRPTISTSSRHMDLVKAIRRLTQSLTSNISFYHLYGHQDKSTCYHNLPRDAQLNVLVDRLAQQELDNAHINNNFNVNAKFHYEGWAVHLGGIKLHDRLGPNIRDWIGRRKLRQYLFDKDMLGWNTFSQIDFTTLRLYLSKQSTAFQLWFTKHWTGFCGIGVMMHRMKLWDNDHCPCCCRIQEKHPSHMFLCPHPHMVHTKQKLFTKILLWLEDVDTDPILLQIIQAFWYNESPVLDTDCNMIYRNIYQCLQEIQVHQMWMGFIPSQMVTVQESYYQLLGRKKSGKSWGTTFIGKMLRASHQLWMERNHMLHCRTISGINGLEMIRLKTAVDRQFELQTTDMSIMDFYLMDRDKDKLLKEPVEAIRGWLCDVLIARGDFDSARLECLKDSQEISHLVPALTPSQLRQYQDWRNVCIAKKALIST